MLRHLYMRWHPLIRPSVRMTAHCACTAYDAPPPPPSLTPGAREGARSRPPTGGTATRRHDDATTTRRHDDQRPRGAGGISGRCRRESRLSCAGFGGSAAAARRGTPALRVIKGGREWETDPTCEVERAARVPWRVPPCAAWCAKKRSRSRSRSRHGLRHHDRARTTPCVGCWFCF